MKPTTNCQVHYVARGSLDGFFPPVCRAAIITEVGPDDAVGLYVINPTGTFHHPLAMGGGIQRHDGSLLGEDPVNIGSTCVRNERLYPSGTWHAPELVAE